MDLFPGAVLLGSYSFYFDTKNIYPYEVSDQVKMSVTGLTSLFILGLLEI